MTTASFLIAVAAAGLMGFANQRGETCTVAAIKEFVTTGRASRFAALVEVSVWCFAGFIILNRLGWLATKPVDFGIGSLTVIGAVVFGIGAAVNRACIFGTVARLGSGEWAYLGTPPGFYLGTLAALYLPEPPTSTRASIVFAAANWQVAIVVVLVFMRVWSHKVAISQGNRSVLQHVWSPRVATTILGIAFLFAFAAVGNWTYTEVLVALAHHTNWTHRAEQAYSPDSHLRLRLVLGVALLVGAVVGGLTARRIQRVLPSVRDVGRRIAGGMLMGFGAALIPGGNTALVLIGVPMLFPYAWLALLIICATIYLFVRITGQTAP